MADRNYAAELTAVPSAPPAEMTYAQRISNFFRPWTDEERAQVAAVMPPDLAPTQIVKGMVGGVANLAMQANEAMPWGGNNPQAIGYDPQAGTIDPSVMIPFAKDVAGMISVGAGAIPGGGLRAGLSMDRASRLARAESMGFNTTEPLYHGGGKSFRAFRTDPPERMAGIDGENAVFFSPSPDEASRFAFHATEGQRGPGKIAGAQVYPVYTKTGRQLVVEPMEYNPSRFSEIIERAREDGYDTVRFMSVVEEPGKPPLDQIAVLKPENIRSVSAKFDPASASSPDMLAASGVPIAGAGQPFYSTGGRF